MDKLGAMQTFIRVVQTGSFSAVAREQNTSQATISKRIAALENLLGAKLLTRNSRGHTMTEIGQNYYERCNTILDEVEEAETEACSLIIAPKGTLRITAPVDFARLYISPFVAEFLRIYSEIKIDLTLTDNVVDLVSGGIDIAIRIGELEDSSLIARRLYITPLVTVATPRYLDAHQEPKHPHELKQHNCLVYSLSSKVNFWNFSHHGKEISVQVNGNFQSDNGDSMVRVLLADMGIAFIPDWLAAPYLEEGSLRQILVDYTKPLPINAIYPQNRYVPLKTKCFVDFLTNKLEENPIFSK